MTPDHKRYLELFPPQKQREWGWPAVANFTLGGAGAGFHLFSVIVPTLGNVAFFYSNTFFLKLLGPILVTVGLMILPIEAGRSSRSFHLIRQLKKSWISREIFFYVIFLLAVLIDYFSPSVPLYLISVGGALGVMISQGFIVYDSKAVTAWNRLAVPWFFLSSGIASGAGVALFLSIKGLIHLSQPFLMAAMFGLAANFIIWIIYLFLPGHGDRAFRSATHPLRRPISLIAILGFGHCLPFGLILFILAAGLDGIGEHHLSYLTILSAVLVIIGVSMQKTALLHQASGKRSIGFNMQ
jgi:DMSO reductase anchor subunit